MADGYEPREKTMAEHMADKDSMSRQIRELKKELKLWKPMTPEEAEAAIEAAEAVPISDERIRRIVDQATDPTYRPSEPEHVLLAAKLRQIDAELNDAADKLSTCWLFLDEIARSECMLSPRHAAGELLRKQQAPGWKSPI